LTLFVSPVSLAFEHADPPVSDAVSPITMATAPPSRRIVSAAWRRSRLVKY
jgi:hypothetical protein